MRSAEGVESGWLDHVVVAVADLDLAVARWQQSGLPCLPAGRHPLGTRNALLRGPQAAYVELLAADNPPHDQEQPVLRRVRSAPGPLAWAIGVPDLALVRRRLLADGHRPGVIVPGSRTTAAGHVVRWRTCQLGPQPMHPHRPFLIEWTQPMAAGPLSGPRLTEMRVQVPDPPLLEDLLAICAVPADPVRIDIVRGRAGVSEIELRGLGPAPTVTLDGLVVHRA